MNTPSPLQPMGRLPQPGSGKPGFNLAVITIVALHAVFLGGLLLQGCGRQKDDTGTPLLATQTNTNIFPDSLAGLGQPYPETTNLAGLAAPGDTLSFTSPSPAAVPTNLWPAPSYTVPTPQPEVAREPEFTELPPTIQTLTLTEYKVAKGDTPGAIAKKHGVTLAQLRESNPDMKDRSLQIGQALMIPPAAPKDVAGATPEADAGVKTYQVKPGDNLTKIAKAHGTTVKALRSLNDLKTDRIVVNQKLKIPPAATNTVEPARRL